MPQSSSGPWRQRLQTWAKIWGLEGLEDRVTVEVSPRLRSALGRCIPSLAVVRLNPALLESPPDLLDEVLCHEFAHVAVFARHGRRGRPHGPQWAALMRAAGFEPRARVKLETVVGSGALLARQRRGRYAHSCPVCGMHRLARRPMRRWLCATCFRAGRTGRLVISRVEPEMTKIPR